MPLRSGTRLGSYEVISALGHGGMGEVYRARDHKLGRDVALKILPDGFATDPERRARFEREARTLASLNHPHIAQIHGLEDSQSINALVMELVEGQDLAERLARGTIAIDEALPIARQIAEALEAAHEQGIVHRDLKPANIKVRADGTVKVLDFGLAKMYAPSEAGIAAGPDLSAATSPTITSPVTVSGTILGTAAYMAPEQAKGKSVDKRVDIWAFGCVLYEMLTGQRAFPGEDVADTIAAVMTKEPEWAALPDATPLAIRRLLRRCLTKNAKQRLPDIGVARLDIDEALDPVRHELVAPSSPASQRSRLVPWAIAAASLAAVALVLALWAPWRAQAPLAPVQVTDELRPDVTLTFGQGRASSVIVSPDGARLAFVALSGDVMRLFVRRFSEPQAGSFAGTDGAVNPFFSPDGQWIAFFADGKLKKVSVDGGAVVTLCDAPSNRGGSWGEDGTIVFAPDRSGVPLARVSQTGGAAQPVTRLADGEITHRWPQVLPGGRAILYTANSAPIGFDHARLVVQELPDGAPKTILPDAYYGRVVPSGHLVYMREGTLFAAPFDVERLEVIGAAVPVIENVENNSASGGAEVAFSSGGIFAYVAGRTLTGALPLVWMDRQKRFTPLRAEPAIWNAPRFSPDGQRVAMAILDRGQYDVWVYDWARSRMHRLTVAAGNNEGPVWTPDGRRIAFSSTRARTTGTDLYWRPVDLSADAQRLTDSDTEKRPDTWHPTGKFLVYTEIGKSSTDLMLLPFEGDEVSGWRPGTPRPFLNSRSGEISAMFSPDGQWLAYESDETGRFEVYVTPFPGPGGRQQISTRGGLWPVWSRAGRQLYFLSLLDGITVVPYQIDGRSFVPGKAEIWADVNVRQRGDLHLRSFDLHPDGERFVLAPPEGSNGSDDRAANRVTLIFNFFEMLQRVAPASR